MTRNGKIARLPKAVRDQLNKNLENGVPGVRLVEWLNTLPEVQTVLTEQFDGRAIIESNLSEWKAGGFLDWQARQDMRSDTEELLEEAQDLKAATNGPLAEQLNVVVAGRYAQLLNRWNGEVDETFVKKVKGLRLLNQDVAAQRRGDLAIDHKALRAERLALEQDKRSEDKKTTQAKALELCLDAAKKFPQVEDAFKKAFHMLDEAEGITGND